MTDRYYSFNKYALERFGKKVYKLALDGGMTCPNLDGTVGKGGCIFCRGGSGAFSQPLEDSVFAQIEKARERVDAKTKDNAFIAYFQSYTNTYAPLPYLEKLFYDAISHPSVVALSVATRPDCLPNDVIALLADVNRIKPVFVELGMQTSHEKTALYIRRGYPLKVYDDAVLALKKVGINVITHVIFGLPGETNEDMLNSVRHVARVGSDGIKIHLLYVESGTDLADDFEKGLFTCLSKDEYVTLLGDAVSLLPPNVVVHRLTGDAPKKTLIAPQWSADKKSVLNAINTSFERRNIVQGSRAEKQFR